MNLAQKVSSGLVALISILVITASVGFYSTYSLSNLLNFITTTAWDTADGAMEGSIGIEAQMLAVERITAGHNDHSNDLLKEGEELADEALNRMIAAGLMSPNELETLNRNWASFNETKASFMQAYQSYVQSKRSLDANLADFQAVMIEAEELGDGQVEELEENPRKLFSWNSGLSEKWSAADGAMEAQIHFLSMIYHYQLFTASEASAREKQLVFDSLASLKTLIEEISSLRVFNRNVVSKGAFTGQSFASALAEQMRTLEEKVPYSLNQFESYLQTRDAYLSSSNNLLGTIEQIEEAADGKVEGEAATVSFTQNLAYTLCLLALVLGLAMAYFGRNVFMKSVVNPIEQLTHNMQLAARKEQPQDNDLHTRDDEIGEIAKALKVFLGLFDENQRISDEASRVTAALQVASTNLMIADNNFNIVYLNQSVQQMFRDAESDLKRDLPNFSADKLLGLNIDAFHKRPEHQRQLLSQMTSHYESSAFVGGRTFKIIANPVYNKDKQRLGTVVEWIDETDMLAKREQEQLEAAENARLKQALDNVSANVMVADADKEIIYLNSALQRTLGDIGSHIKTVLPDFDPDHLLGSSISQFQKLSETNEVIPNLLDQEHTSSFEVDGCHLSVRVNPVKNTQQKLIGIVSEWFDRTSETTAQLELDQIVNAASTGDFSGRIKLTGKQGFFLNLSEGLNDILDNTNRFISDLDSLFGVMAKGDLTQTASSQYQGDFKKISDNVNTTLKKLRSVLSEVVTISHTVSRSATEIAQGSLELSNRTESQASSLQQTASSMEEITATVTESERNSGLATVEANEAKSRAEAGGAIVDQAVIGMKEISASSKKINDIIGVIDEIAFQTNLLALNAAVEAARAGDQGRGFAVVAGEVRALSQRSSAAAKQIKDLIQDSVSKVETGAGLVNETGETLAGIVNGVDIVANRINSISLGSKEQSSGISQINQAISQIDDMTQQNAALVEETSSAANALNDQAKRLQELVVFFKA